ncbi:MAG: hypothetical protein GY838_04990 [bacterium]|nr:hypothetical protein [bacterium]
MVAAIFRTKFTIPSLPADYRPRPRLDALWQGWRDRRLVTVVAGAGWGKTCFLAAHARKHGRRILWYTLDELDRDPDLLAAHLAAACDLPPSGAPALEQLAGIVAALADRSLLVLDDVHTVKGATAAREFLARLLRYLPSDCRLILAGRGPVSLAGAGLDVRGRAARLWADDLAYESSETTDQLVRRLGRAAGTAAAPDVQSLTEGWPMGVAIVAQALAETGAEDHAEALERLGTGGVHWFDFFAEEVLTGLEQETCSFLERAAVLPHLEASLCDEVLGIDDSALHLEILADRGIFTVPVGEGAWRFHHLFRNSLLRRTTETMAPRRLQALRRKAAGSQARCGEPEAGFLELARAGDVAGAHDLVRRHLEPLLRLQRSESLTAAFAALDPRGETPTPPVRLLRATLSQFAGRWDEAEQDLAKVARSGAARRITSSARANLVVLQMRRDRFTSCLRRGKTALDADRALVPADRGAVLAAMGVSAASLGRLDQGAEHLGRALASARRRDDRAEEGRCRYLLAANVHFIRGDLDRALAEAEAACSLFRDLGRPDLVCHAEGVLGFVQAGGGRVMDSRRVTRRALRRAEAIGYPLVAGYAHLSLGECGLRSDDMTEAEQHFAAALDIAGDLGEEVLATWARLGLAEAAWGRGDTIRTAREAEQALAPAVERGDRFCEARALCLTGLALRAEDPVAADASRKRAATICRKLGATLEATRHECLWRDRGEAAGSDASVPGGNGSLRLQIMGALVVERNSEDLDADRWRSRRARRLLNLLLAHGLRPVPREVIQEALWPDAEPRKSAVSLRQTVFQLRGLLEDGESDEPRHVLSCGSDALRLDPGPDGGWDLGDFRSALDTAAEARSRGDQDAELTALQNAVVLWRGPLLADTPYDAAVEELAASIRHRYLRAVERTLDLLVALERHDEAVDLARRGLETDGLHEGFARHMLQGLAATNRRTEVLREYEDFASRLLAELDLLPAVGLKKIVEGASG